MRLPQIIAHRGANQLFPENTMAAFKKARTLGINWIELDVQLSKDNILFIFHDNNAKRLTGVDYDLTECDFDDIAELSVLVGKFSKTEKYSIPTLTEYLNWMLDNPKIHSNIEIKAKEKSDPIYEKRLAEAVIALLKDYPGLHARIILSSFSEVILQALANFFTKENDVALVWLAYIENWQQYSGKPLNAIYAKFNQYHCVALGINSDVLINQARVDQLKTKFQNILAYSTDVVDMDQASAFIEYGVDSVFVDDIVPLQQHTPTTIGLLGTGDEITTGDIVNTNTPRLAREIYAMGFRVGSHLVCRDDQAAIESSLRFLLKHHNVVITVGGLGPTEDDKTMLAVAAVSQCELKFSAESWQRIKARISKRTAVIPENNKKQAYFPEGAKILPNHHGTADGCYLCLDHNQYLLVLPGPPHECMAMFHSCVQPLLKEIGYYKARQVYYWQLLGASEAEISNQLKPLALAYGEHLGYRAAWPYLEVKLHSNSPSAKLAALINKIEEILAPFIATTNQAVASQLLKKYLAVGNIELTIHKDMTKGYIGSQLMALLPKHINNPQFCIALSTEGMVEFWQKNAGVSDKISVKINFTDYNNDHCSEKVHTTQYITKGKHSFVFAYEWVCAAILALLEQEVGNIE